ncbi:MAG: hypothetical protein RL329_2723 [Bacteroidota bacterium]|jgi:hypothetical protein
MNDGFCFENNLSYDFVANKNLAEPVLSLNFAATKADITLGEILIFFNLNSQ